MIVKKIRLIKVKCSTKSKCVENKRKWPNISKVLGYGAVLIKTAERPQRVEKYETRKVAYKRDFGVLS